MHILFLSHNFPPEVNALATRTFEHCRRWVAAGHRVTVVTCAPNFPRGVVFEGYRNAWVSQEEMEGIQVVRVWTLLAPNEGFFRRTVYYLSYMFRSALFAITLRDVDVVVSSTPQFFGGWAGVLCRWARWWPFVLEVRDIWPESILAVGAMKRSWLIRVLEWLEHRMYDAASHIVTVGNGYKSQLLERGVPESKISVVPNGVDLSSRARTNHDDAIRQGLGADGKFVCSYIGTIGMAHGLEVMIKAAELLHSRGRHDIQFWVVGDGAEKAQLQAEAQRRGLTNIVFTGLITKDRVGRFIASSDACLVHLRGTELFGTVIPSKIFEIMDASVPIIMGVRGEACELVINNQAGVEMTPDDPVSLVQCLDRVAANPSAFQGGRQFVEEHYNRDHLADRMLRVLQQQASMPKPILLELENKDSTATEPSRRAA